MPYANNQGVRIHYEVEGEGPPLVLMHPGFLSLEFWRLMAWGLGSSIVSFGGGYIIASSGYRSLFLIGAGLTMAGAVIFRAYSRVPRGELAQGSAGYDEGNRKEDEHA
jgi:hypothetical protein